MVKIYEVHNYDGEKSYHCLNCGEVDFEPFSECGICGLKEEDLKEVQE